MKRVINIILILTFCCGILVKPISAQSSHDIFKGIAISEYDGVVSGNARVEDDGSIFMTEKNTVLLYKGVDFYKDITHMQITYSTQEFTTPRELELRADSPEGDIISEILLGETTRYTNVVTDTIELQCDLSGEHDLYLVDLNGNSGRIFSIKFYGLWEALQEAPKQENDYTINQELFQALEIILQTKDESYKNDFVSRAEAAAVICRAFKLGVTIRGDRPQDASDTSVYLEELLKRGLVKTTGGFINPDSIIAVADYLKICIDLSGYGKVYPTADKSRDEILSIALKLGLCRNGSNEYLKYGDMIEITMNTLKLGVMKFDISTETYEITQYSNLEEIHDVKKSMGLIKVTDVTALSNVNASCAKGYVQIDDKNYLSGNSKAEEYLGYRVNFYYSEHDEDLEVLTVYGVNKLNQTLIVNDEDIEGVRSDMFQYNNKNGILKTETIPTTADVLYNGVSYSQYTDEDFNIYEGRVEFIDNNLDGKWDVVSIISADVYIVDSVDREREIIYLKTDDDFAPINALTKIDLGADETVNYKIYIDGIRVNCEELGEGDVVSVYNSKVNAGVYTNRIIKASSTVVTESVVRIDGEGVCFLSDGSQYSIVKSCNQNPELGVNYAIHLTDSGKIAWFEGNAASRSFEYGYLLKTYFGYNAECETVITIKLLDDESHVSKLECNDKIKINGKSFKNRPEEAYSYLLDGETQLMPQVIRYEKNSMDKITMIDTVVKGPGEDETSLKKVLRYNQADFRNVTDYFWRVAPIEDNTVIFVVPYDYDDLENANDYADSEFSSMKNARQFAGINQYCEGYDGSAVKPLGAVVKYKNASKGISESTPMIYITDFCNVLNDRDEEVIEVTGVYDGKVETLRLSERTTWEFKDYIKKGDVWLFQKNGNGEIDWLSLIWSRNNPDGLEMTYDLNENTITYGSMFICYGSEILDKYKNNISINVLGEESGFSLNDAVITVYDVASRSARTITVDEIAKNSQTSKTQYVFLYAYSHQTRQLLIINE